MTAAVPLDALHPSESLDLCLIDAQWSLGDLEAAWALVRSHGVIREFKVACPASLVDAFDSALDLPAHVTSVTVHMRPRLLWCAMCVARLPCVEHIVLDACNSKAHCCAIECARDEFVGDAVRLLLRGAPRLASLELRFCGSTFGLLADVVSTVDAHAPASLASASLTYSAFSLQERDYAFTTRRGIAWTIHFPKSEESISTASRDVQTFVLRVDRIVGLERAVPMTDGGTAYDVRGRGAFVGDLLTESLSLLSGPALAERVVPNSESRNTTWLHVYRLLNDEWIGDEIITSALNKWDAEYCSALRDGQMGFPDGGPIIFFSIDSITYLRETIPTLATDRTRTTDDVYRKFFTPARMAKKSSPLTSLLGGAGCFLLPWNIGRTHWALVEVNLIKGTVRMLDTLYPRSKRDPQVVRATLLVNNLVAWATMEELGPDVLAFTFTAADGPTQQPAQANLLDCGVLTCLMARAFFKLGRVPTDDEIRTFASQVPTCHGMRGFLAAHILSPHAL